MAANSSLKLRTTFYSLTLVSMVFQGAFGFVSGFIDGFSRYLYIFGKITGAIGFLFVAWITVLFVFYNRPKSRHFLAKASTHLVSFLCFILVLMALSIMTFTQAPAECDFERFSDGEAAVWCSMTLISGILGIITSVFAGVMAWIIYRGAKRSNRGLGMNVAHVDEGNMVIPDELPLQ